MRARRAAFVPYPFAAIVAADEARTALLLAAINPRVGGVLLSGPKGIGKTTLVRGLAELLPPIERADCAYGCDPGGSALCDDCAAGRSGLARAARTDVVELPANAQIDDVVGTVDLQAALERGAFAFRPGLLARANRAILYVDEINLLSDAVVDVLLDAAAQGVVRVRRGQHAVSYPSRFSLVGTMNPEEGELRPQITDRLGLRVFVMPAHDAAERAEIYRRNAAFARDPRAFAATFASRTKALRTKVARAIALLPEVTLDDDAVACAIDATTRLGIESHRTEFVALEAAIARAAFEGRTTANAGDVHAVFPLAARLRRSRLRVQASNEYLAEDAAIARALAESAQTADDAQSETHDAEPAFSISPVLAERPQIRERPQSEREGAAIESRPRSNGRVDMPATVLDRAVATRSGGEARVKESVDAATPMRLTVFVVDASQSTAKSARAVQVAAEELLRPIYAERERAALISCWGVAADVVVDENVGRNVELVAARLSELEPGETRALTPLPDALERARRIAERFRRAHPEGQVEIAIFSDGRANVPLGAAGEIEGIVAASDARALAESAAEQCRTLAARFAGRATSTFVNLDGLETSGLMRELAGLARGRYFALNEVVAALG